MRKVLLAFTFLLASAVGAFGQSTTVSGTVTDAGSQAWTNGTYKFLFVPNPQYPTGPYTWTGGTLNFVISGSLDGSGNYSVSVPSSSAITPVGSKWILQVTPNATSPSFSTAATTITGGTQTLNATPPAILIPWSLPPGPAISAYADGEIGGTLVPGSEYFNTTSLVTRVWNGSAWTNQGAGAGGGSVGNNGDIQFSNGAGAFQNANGILAGTSAFIHPNGSLSLVGINSVTLAATSATSNAQIGVGSGGVALNSVGGIVASEGAALTYTSDTGDISDTSTLGNINLTASGGTITEIAAGTVRESPIIEDVVGSASAVTPGSVTQRVVTTTTDTILNTDRNNRVAYNSTSAVAVTLPQAASSGFDGGFNSRLSNQNAGTVTVTPTTSTINGNATLVLQEGQDCFITPSSTGTNWAADCNEPQITAGSGISLTRGVHSLTITNAGSTGTVTNIATTSPITGGPITTTGTIACGTCTTNAAALTSNALVIGGGGQAVSALGSLGTTTTVLHGNAAGAPTFGAVNLATDVTGQLPIGSVGSAGLSGTSPITISAAGAIACSTCNTSAATVTSVSFTGGLISVATPTTTPAFTVAGTSGGIPYFSSTSTWASSAALTANILVKGGGAGAAPSNSGITDNGTTVSTSELATLSGTGAASTSPFLLNGTMFTGGSGTTTFPYAFINQGASNPSSWSTSGTMFGLNGPSGFAGNFVDFHLNGGTSIFLVNTSGTVTTTGTINLGASSGLVFTGRSELVSGANGTLTAHNNTGGGNMLQSDGFQSIGTKFTASGCSNGTTLGGATVGSFLTGVSAGCSVTITMGDTMTATTGWSCWATDGTTATGNPISQTGAASTTTATLTLPAGNVSGDLIRFGCLAY
jgi:hypothetical protein